VSDDLIVDVILDGAVDVSATVAAHVSGRPMLTRSSSS
jgi:hypothetical protein